MSQTPIYDQLYDQLRQSLLQRREDDSSSQRRATNDRRVAPQERAHQTWPTDLPPGGGRHRRPGA